MSSDQILRGILRDRGVRIVATLATGTAREAVRRHKAVGAPAAALGRAAAAGLLLATLTKDRDRITLQLLSDGPLGGLTIDANSDGEVRAFLKNPWVPLPAVPGRRISLGDGIGRHGLVSVVRDLGMRENFSGQTTVVDGEIDTDIEHYLVMSEQIDSVLACDALVGPNLEITICGGVLVQALPNSDATPYLEELRAAARGGLVAELLGSATPPDSAEALARGFLGAHAAELAALDVRPVRFSCPCSRERAANSLVLLGDDELEDMVAKGEDAAVMCEFCREKYAFAPAEVAALKDEAKRRSRSAS